MGQLVPSRPAVPRRLEARILRKRESTYPIGDVRTESRRQAGVGETRATGVEPLAEQQSLTQPDHRWNFPGQTAADDVAVIPEPSPSHALRQNPPNPDTGATHELYLVHALQADLEPVAVVLRQALVDRVDIGVV